GGGPPGVQKKAVRNPPRRRLPYRPEIPRRLEPGLDQRPSRRRPTATAAQPGRGPQAEFGIDPITGLGRAQSPVSGQSGLTRNINFAWVFLVCARALIG